MTAFLLALAASAGAFVATTAQLIATTAMSYLMGHLFSWLKILVGFIVLNTLFGAFIATGWLDGVKEFIIYMEVIGIFPLLTEDAVVWYTNIFLLWTSFAVLSYLFGEKNLKDSDVAPDQYVGRDGSVGYRPNSSGQRVKRAYM